MGGRDFVRAWPESPRAIAHLIPDVVARDLPFLIADSSRTRRPGLPPGTSHAHQQHDPLERDPPPSHTHKAGSVVPTHILHA